MSTTRATAERLYWILSRNVLGEATAIGVIEDYLSAGQKDRAWVEVTATEAMTGGGTRTSSFSILLRDVRRIERRFDVSEQRDYATLVLHSGERLDLTTLYADAPKLLEGGGK